LKNPYALAVKVGRRMETMAVPNIEGDGESCKKNPAQKAG
jgi:hypothetical protein